MAVSPDFHPPATGVTIYLNNSNGTPTAGGAATALGTTPWMLRSPQWTPKAAEPQTLWSGGAPFRNGVWPVSQSYPLLQETIPLILVGSTTDIRDARLQQLRELANAALTLTPAVFSGAPANASNAVCFEILAA